MHSDRHRVFASLVYDSNAYQIIKTITGGDSETQYRRWRMQNKLNNSGRQFERFRIVFGVGKKIRETRKSKLDCVLLFLSVITRIKMISEFKNWQSSCLVLFWPFHMIKLQNWFEWKCCWFVCCGCERSAWCICCVIEVNKWWEILN